MSEKQYSKRQINMYRHYGFNKINLLSQQSQEGAILCYAKNILSLLCAGWGDPKPPPIF